MRDPCINCQEEERGCYSRCPYRIKWEKRQKTRKEKIDKQKEEDAIYGKSIGRRSIYNCSI